MKRIAIDARPLSQKLTGIGRYLHCILKELFKLNENVIYYLYSDKTILVDFSEFQNVIIRCMNNKNKILSHAYCQILFPIWSCIDKIDTYWSPRQHLPLLLFFNKKMNKVLTVHDLVWLKCPETMTKSGLLLEKLLFKPSLEIANKIITLSNFTKDEIVESFIIDANDIFVSGAGCFNFDVYVEEENGKASPPYILFVGTLEPRKNLKNLLSAFSIFHKSNTHYRLKIVGGKGWGDISVIDICISLGIENVVDILGFVDDKALCEIYSGCSLLTMPSLYEGFGLPAIEALAYKKKVLVSKNTAIPELKISLKDNIYISGTSSESIALTMKSALKSEVDVFVEINKSWKEAAFKTRSFVMECT